MDTIESKGMRLVVGGRPVLMGTVLAGFRVLGGSAPRHDGAKGRVYVQDCSGRKRELTPDEIGADWEMAS